ncbi:MAG: hypothetical protein QF783_01970, partial [Arenicellales bacterium]|nr:hypothetical protein [Arenicellales bacterium]
FTLSAKLVPGRAQTSSANAPQIKFLIISIPPHELLSEHPSRAALMEAGPAQLFDGWQHKSMTAV